MSRHTRRIGVLAGLVTATVVACATPTPRPEGPPPAQPFTVGVTSDAPPYAFRREGRLAGLEVDFATELGQAIGRPLRLLDLEFEQLIPALLDGRVDVIMAGMTITRARELRIAFSQPYLSSGLAALVRRSDAGRFSSPEQVRSTTRAVGTVSGTTGDRYVREQCPQATLQVYPTASAAVDELRTNRIDALVHDAPVLAWYLGTDEANLAVVLPPLNREPLGWGLRQGDAELRSAVDAALARWRSDGTRERILSRWIPFWSRLEQAR